MVTDAKLVKDFLVCNYECYEKEPNISNSFRRVLGEGIFLSEGHKWKF